MGSMDPGDGEDAYGFDFGEARRMTPDERFDAGMKAIEIFAPSSNREWFLPDEGATEDEIAALERGVGGELPAEHRAFLRRWRFFRFYRRGIVYGVRTDTPRVEAPWLADGWLFIARVSGVANMSFLVVDPAHRNGPVSHLDRWDSPAMLQLGSRLAARVGGDVTPYAPSFSLAFWRACREMTADLERAREAGERVSVRDDGLEEFEIRVYEPGIEHYGSARVDSWKRGLDPARVVAGDVIVIEDDTISIAFAYPLERSAVLEFRQEGGFTRLDLLRCIYEGYEQLYREEEQQAGDPGNAPGLENRAPSDGPHGIWGHHLAHLFVEGLTYSRREKLLSLSIGS